MIPDFGIEINLSKKKINVSMGGERIQNVRSQREDTF